MRIPWLSRASTRLPVYQRLDTEVQAEPQTTSSSCLSTRRTQRAPLYVLLTVAIGSAFVILFSFSAHIPHPYRRGPPIFPPLPPHLLDKQRLLSAALPVLVASGAELPSTRWAPVSISTCQPGMHPYLAPCLAQRREGAIYGEELVYPDFRLRQPFFSRTRVENDTLEWWKLVDGIRERGSRCSDKEWVCYRGQNGQNLVLANATYRGSPPADSWSDAACMSDGVSTAKLETTSANSSNNNFETQSQYDEAFPVDTLLVATSPDSWSFQHFLDRVTHIIAQGSHLALGQRIDAVAGRTPGSAVSEMWEMLGFPSPQVHYNSPRVAAKALVFSCRAPLVHPWLSLRSLETFGLDPTSVPLEKRKKVVYFSRSHGNVANGGRRVLNENQMLDQIRELLAERGQGEELVLFHDLGFHSQADLMRWFHQNVRGVLGPHGGGLYNHRWAGKDTLVLELMPKTFTSLMFWEEASLLSQVYATMVLPQAGYNDMLADIPAMLDILRERLGRPDVRGPSIEEMYRWHAPELELPH
ncbi:hypothetical protein C8Q79DRAFT_519183 [Trametes meyenii]|nr:hypothetical protein C8Q79DRAFT_519183 [Trametes meyenii]